MASEEAKRRWRERIRTNIDTHGYHVTHVKAGDAPSFAYTVGLTELNRPEVIFAGGMLLNRSEIIPMIDRAAQVPQDLPPVHPTWAKHLLLGAFDFYVSPTAVQLLPDAEHRTLDVPDLSQRFDPAGEPAWRWLIDPCPHELPPDAMAATDPDALRGEPISEGMRWEDNHWELYSRPGPDVPNATQRIVPLQLLLALDPSLEPFIHLDSEQGLWREPFGDWRAWD